MSDFLKASKFNMDKFIKDMAKQMAECPIVTHYNGRTPGQSPVGVSGSGLNAGGVSKGADKPLPSGFTWDEWTGQGSFVVDDTPDVKGVCNHDWVIYRGLLSDDYYCTKCNQTKPLDPSK